MISITRTRAIIVALTLAAQPVITAGALELAHRAYRVLQVADIKTEEARTYRVAMAAAMEGAKTPLQLLGVRDLSELEQRTKLAEEDARTSVGKRDGNQWLVPLWIAVLLIQGVLATWVSWLVPVKKRANSAQNNAPDAAA